MSAPASETKPALFAADAAPETPTNAETLVDSFLSAAADPNVADPKRGRLSLFPNTLSLSRRELPRRPPTTPLAPVGGSCSYPGGFFSRFLCAFFLRDLRVVESVRSTTPASFFAESAGAAARIRRSVSSCASTPATHIGNNTPSTATRQNEPFGFIFFNAFRTEAETAMGVFESSASEARRAAAFVSFAARIRLAALCRDAS